MALAVGPQKLPVDGALLGASVGEEAFHGTALAPPLLRTALLFAENAGTGVIRLPGKKKKRKKKGRLPLWWCLWRVCRPCGPGSRA